MYSFKFNFVILAVTITLVSATNILDLLYWTNYEDAIEKRDESDDLNNVKTCNCNGPLCMCCVDFNLTYIDLGGPGCVQMKYISQDDGINVNVSYGESVLHNKQVKGPNPEPTCMSILTNLAQVCARFLDLKPYNNGLRGCLLLEPKLLGDVTASFNIGCFTMGPEGMILDDSVTNSTISPISENTNGTQTDSEGLNEEELIAAVNESAQQGLVFFGNLLGLSFTEPKTNQTNTEPVTTITNSNNENSNITES